MREAGPGTGLLASGEPEGGPCWRRRRRVRTRPPWLGQRCCRLLSCCSGREGRQQGQLSRCSREAGTPAHPEPHGYTAGAPAPRNLGSPRMLGSPRHRAAAPTPHPEHSAPGVTAAASHSENWPFQVHPPQDTKASGSQHGRQCGHQHVSRGSQQPRVSSRNGGLRHPQARTTLAAQRRWSREQTRSEQRARPPAPTLRPQHTLQGSHPAQPLLPGACRLTLRAASPRPGPCDPRCGGLSVRAAGCAAGAHRSQGGVRGPGWGLPKPTELRGQNRRRPSRNLPGGLCGAGASWDQLPRNGQEWAWTGAWRAVSAPDRAGGLQGSGRLPRMVAEPRASKPPSCTFTLFLNLPLG